MKLRFIKTGSFQGHFADGAPGFISHFCNLGSFLIADYRRKRRAHCETQFYAGLTFLAIRFETFDAAFCENLGSCTKERDGLKQIIRSNGKHGVQFKSAEGSAESHD